MKTREHRRRRVPSLVSLRDDPEDELLAIASVLNGQAFYDSPNGVESVLRSLGISDDKSEKRSALLRQYVDALMASGQDLNIFVERNPEMWAAIEKQWKAEPPDPFPMPGRLVFLWRNAESGRPERDAIQLFITLLTNVIWLQLSAPCARCGNYYVRRTARGPKVYCSKNCGARTTALAATNKRRAREMAAKVAKANDMIQQWKSSGSKKDWKIYVTGRDPSIKKKWLTQAVNRGDLRTPVRQTKES